jgi:enterochelin esterase-like enzyme
MRKLAVTASILAAAVGITVVGLFGAYGYGRDYYLHRGFAALVQLPRGGTGRLLAVNYYSTALHRRAGYMVYLPPGYSSHRRYPVYYMLHGMPGQPKVFVDIANMDVRLDNQLALGHARPMILVYPDGRIGGSVLSDSEWANTPSGNYESYVIEVMHNLDQRFSTLARRQDRVIAGFSAGAYGALNIALHHLSDFANVQSWSGYFTQTRSGVFAAADPANLAYNSPLKHVARLGRSMAADPLGVYVFAGRSDPASRQQQPIVNALRGGGAQVQASLYPGGHDWSVWYPRLNQMLDLASSDFARPVIAGNSRPASRAARPGPGGPALPVVGSYGAATAPSNPTIRHHVRQPASELRLLGALLLALISGVLINLGFVLQQRGHSHALARGRYSLIEGFRDRSWLIGQSVGWLGFAGAIIAVGLAPLTLVQAFSAGSLALSVPLAARLVGQSVTRQQLIAIAIITICLASLPIGFAASHGHLHAGILIAAALLAMATGAVLAPVAGSLTQAIAAGVLYGAADAAIKADAVALHVHGVSSVLCGWTVLAGLCTFGGFLSFQVALRGSDAVRPVSLMTAFTAVTAAGLGVVAFGEPFGITPVASVAHGVAIALVLACVVPLARMQQRLILPRPAAESADLDDPPARESEAPHGESLSWPKPASTAVLLHTVRVVGATVFACLAVAVCSLVMFGLLYKLRGVQPLATGPSVPDALPLLQLAGFDPQPMSAVVLSGLAAGAVLGTALSRASRSSRLVFVAILGSVLLILASDASYALARNLRLDEVLLNRAPGIGPWLEGLLLAAGSVAVPRRRGIDAARLTTCLRGGQSLRQRLVLGTASAARRRLVLVPLAAGVAAALLGALVLPSGHAHAQPRPPRTPTDPVQHTASRAASQQVRARATETPRAAPTQATGRLLHVTFYSEALRRTTDYVVYLPPNYTPARRLPVFYLLHGMPGRPQAFTVNASIETRLDRLIARHAVQPMILVFPDGRIGGRTATDSEWANTPAGRFESCVLDVVHDVDHRFATLPSRGDRAIAGLSAGAYGAANIALHQLALFGLVQVWSGYFTQTRTGVFSHATRAQLAYNSPSDYAHTLRAELTNYPLRAFLYTGSDDSDRDQTPAMTAALSAAGADAHYAIYSGGHNWNLWSLHMDQMLSMASRFFVRPASSAPSHRT